MWRQLVNKLRYLFHRERIDRDLAEEFDFHREMLERANRQAGLDDERAQRTASLQLGNLAVAREDARNAWSFGWLESLGRDLKLAVRGCRRSPAFSVAAIFTLALGIGANTAVFRVLDRVVLRPLPVRDPQSLVRLQLQRDGKPQSFSYQLYAEFARRQESLAGIFAAVDVPEVLVGTTGSDPVPNATARLVSGGFFRVLGVHPVLGRTIRQEDDEPTATPVAVISHGFWHRALGGRSDVEGGILEVNHTKVVVVGVLPAGFFGEQIGSSPDVWLPLSLANPLSVGWLIQPGSASLTVMGRLRPSIPRDQAQAALDAVYRRVSAEDIQVKGTRTRALQVLPGSAGSSGVRDQVSPALWMLMAVVALIVLVACCNLASLLLARGASRAHEIEVRLALGATRGRVVRQLMTESLLLAGVGSILGAIVSAWVSGALVRELAAGATWTIDLRTDWRVAAFASLLAGITACVFGLPPAFRTTRGRLSLQSSARNAIASASSRRVAKSFLVMQVAGSLVLVAAAFLFGRSFWNLTHQDFGYRPNNLLFVRLPFDIGSFRVSRDPVVRDTLLRSLSGLGGVRSVGLAGAGPFGSVQSRGKMSLLERPAVETEQARYASVSAGYFEAMGMTVLQGRSFTPADRGGGPRVAVISETAARQVFGRQSPIGRLFSNSDRFEPATAIEIVGVVHDLRFDGPRDPHGIVVFRPLDQAPAPLTSVVVRTHADPMTLRPAVEQTMKRAAAGLKVTDVVALTDLLNAGVAQERTLASLTASLGGLALLLAAIGVYGLTAYGIAQRTPEIGVRLVLGASRTRLVNEILGEMGALFAVGLTAGCAVTVAIGRLLRGFLADLSPQDPVTLSLAALCLVLVAALASVLGALRVLALDPAETLRRS